jgi:hypothetical protein
MYEDVTSFLQRADSLIVVFNYPVGFWHLAQILTIDPKRWFAKSEVIYVLSKPSTAGKEIDCGAIITPHLDCVQDIKNWAGTYLEKPWREVISNIIRIQELQLKNYEFEMRLLEYKYNSETMRPFAPLIYKLEEKISKVKRSTTLLHCAVSAPDVLM